MRNALVISLVALTVAACGCKNKSGAGAGNGAGPASCEAHAGHVQGLYAAAALAAAKPGEKPATAALREQEAADNTAMVVADCRKEPARFAPCLQAASSVQQLERDCLIPLDDAGDLEGDYFEKRAAAAGAN